MQSIIMYQLNLVKLPILLILVLNILSCSSNTNLPEGITEVQIRNNEFKVIKNLSLEEIQFFEKSFLSFQKIEEAPITGWTHKIDIISKKLNGRWLYSDAGYISKLNYSLKPSYKISNVAEFNKKIIM